MNIESMRAFVKDLASMKWYIAASAVLFFIGAAIGYGNESLHDFLNGQIEGLAGAVERLDSMENTQLWMFLFIFFNNFIKSVLIVFLGALFGIIPVYFLLVNGMILGYMTAIASQSGVNVAAMLIQGILPHGVLELTAIFIAAGYGLKYGSLIFGELTRAIRGKASVSGIREFHGTLKRLIAFLFLALLAAAFIESTVTYFLVRG